MSATNFDLLSDFVLVDETNITNPGLTFEPDRSLLNFNHNHEFDPQYHSTNNRRPPRPRADNFDRQTSANTNCNDPLNQSMGLLSRSIDVMQEMVHNFSDLMGKMDRPKLKVFPPTSFNVDSGEDIENFLHSYIKYCEFNYQGNEGKTAHLRQYLKGEALEAFDHIFKVNSNFDDICKYLVEWFGEIKKNNKKRKF